MVDPAVALTVFALLVLSLAAILWPRRGIVARAKRAMRVSERIRIEDAVKYLFHAGEDGAPVRPEALAGALTISINSARELLGRLVTRKVQARGSFSHRKGNPTH